MVLTGLTKYRDEGLLMLRIGIGVAFIFHGLPKLIAGPGQWEWLGNALGLPAPVFFGFLAAIIEFGGGILIALGLLFRPACILLVLQMLGAMAGHFMSPDLTSEYGPGWSHPMKMAIVFLALILIGPGRYSIDRQ